MTRAVTLRDVAQRAGVSTAATSQALNDRGHLKAETRERIKAVARELGYTPNKHATALRSGRSMSFGVLIGADDSASLPHYRRVTSLLEAASEHGFTVTLIPETRPDLVRGAQIDALYVSSGCAVDAVLEDVAARSIPMIVDDVEVPAELGISVRTGYQDAAEAGLELLADGGARRIGFLVEDAAAPRTVLGERVYREWCARRGRDPFVLRVDPAGRHLARRVTALLEDGADAIFSFCGDGPEIYLQLEASARVIPRDLQFVALCASDCDMNRRLGVTTVCVHPEHAAEAIFAALHLASMPSTSTRCAVDLPWEIVRGSSTR